MSSGDPAISVPHFSNAGVTDEHYPTVPHFYVGIGDTKSGPHDGTVNTLPAEASPQSHLLKLCNMSICILFVDYKSREIPEGQLPWCPCWL